MAGGPEWQEGAAGRYLAGQKDSPAWQQQHSSGQSNSSYSESRGCSPPCVPGPADKLGSSCSPAPAAHSRSASPATSSKYSDASSSGRRKGKTDSKLGADSLLETSQNSLRCVVLSLDVYCATLITSC